MARPLDVLPPGCSDLSGRSILITGGAGTIGSRLATTLAPHADVTILDDLTSGTPRNVPDKVRLVNGSILEPRSLRQALGTHTDVVFHLAALFANQNSVEHPEQDLMVNGLGTLRVLETAIEAGAESIVYASSSCVYGAQAGELREHQVPGRLETPYAITKYLGELYASYFTKEAEQHGARVTCVRYFNVYGPGELPGQYRNVIPNFIAAALEGRPLTITGTGDETRDFTFVDDAARGTMLAAIAGHAGEVYNIGTGHETRIIDLARSIVDLSNSTSPIVVQERRAWDSVSHRRAAIAKSTEHLGYSSTVTIEEGLSQTARWLQEQLTPVADGRS